MSDEKKAKEAKKPERAGRLFAGLLKESPATALLGHVYWSLFLLQKQALESGDIARFEELENDKHPIWTYLRPLGADAPNLLGYADELFRERVLSRSQLERVEAICKRRRKGTPPKARTRTLDALDKRIRDQVGWEKLGKEFCPKASDAGHEHTEFCEDLIRHQVREAEKLLDKWYGQNVWRGRKA